LDPPEAPPAGKSKVRNGLHTYDVMNDGCHG